MNKELASRAPGKSRFLIPKSEEQGEVRGQAFPFSHSPVHGKEAEVQERWEDGLK